MGPLNSEALSALFPPVFAFSVDSLSRQGPIIFVCLASLFCAVRWRKTSPAWVWVVAGVGATLAVSGFFVIGPWAYFPLFYNYGISVLRALALLCLVVAAFWDRKVRPDADPADTVGSQVLKQLRSRPGLVGVFFKAAAAVFLLVVLSTAIYAFILPEKFIGVARVQSSETDQQALSTECEVVQSTPVLEEAIKDLDLSRRWARRIGIDSLKSTETLMLLRRCMDVVPFPGTRLIEIKVIEEEPKQAAELANAVAKAYVAYRKTGGGVAKADILDLAVPQLRPYFPDKGTIIAAGFWGGLWLGVACGAAVVWLAVRFGRAPVGAPAPA